MLPIAKPGNARTGLAAALLGLAMLLLTHRYWGIDHDATLYMGEALRLLSPDIYNHDLYFAHGSQGKYTLFPWVLAQLMGWLDPAALFFWGGLAGLLAFAWASWFCLSSLLPGGQRYWAWLGVLGLPASYGRTVIFSYAEPFLTPRPFAEALALVALGLGLRRNILGALACLGLAGMLHPLQALAAALVLWPWAVLQDRRWLHALWLILPICCAALMGLAPFDGLLLRVDQSWWVELRGITGQLFVTGWPRLDYQYLVFDAALLAYAWHARQDDFGRLCLATLVGLLLGVGASLVLVEGLHLILPTGLQLWRVHWLAHWLAMAAFALHISRDLLERAHLRAALLTLTGLLAWGAIAWAWVPFALLYWAWPRVGPQLQPRILRVLASLIGIAISLLLVQHIAMELVTFRLANYRLDAFAIDRRILAYPLLAFGLPFAAAMAWQRIEGRGRALLAVAGLVPLVALAALRWDIQIPQRRLVLEQAGHPELFATPLPRHAQVYWHDMSLVATWLVLGRADYYDQQHLSGIAFNPGTIREARRRLGRIGPLLDSVESCKLSSRDGTYAGCSIPDPALARACGPGEVLHPDFLVLPFDLSFPPEGRWRRMSSNGRELLADWSLYSCSSINRALKQADVLTGQGSARAP
ncbi:hypothetical protein GCM10010080_25600 [Thermomonas carbonis]|nr:hypothetical protein GCM10010080_25600 [Thermomonas carbonis]